MRKISKPNRLEAELEREDSDIDSVRMTKTLAEAPVDPHLQATAAPPGDSFVAQRVEHGIAAFNTTTRKSGAWRTLIDANK